jgi:hypothetical protein
VKAKGRKNITMDIILKSEVQNPCQNKRRKKDAEMPGAHLKKKTRVECVSVWAMSSLLACYDLRRSVVVVTD